jgi:hypothetical protein
LDCLKHKLKSLLSGSWPSVVWVIVILILTGIPGGIIPAVPRFLNLFQPDKLVHIFIFAVYVFFLTAALSQRERKSFIHNNAREIAVFTGIILSGLTELMQVYIIWGRSGNVYDFIADAIGCLAGIWVTGKLLEKIESKN